MSKRVLTITIFLLFFLFVPVFTFAQNASNINDAGLLQDEIKKKNDKIEQLNQEIEIYKKENEKLEEKRTEFSSVLRGYQVTKNLTDAEIRRLQTRIDKSNLEIRRLNQNINKSEQHIGGLATQLAVLYRKSNEISNAKPLHTLLMGDNFLSVSETAYDFFTIVDALNTKINQIKDEQEILKGNIGKRSEEKDLLNDSQVELIDKNVILRRNINQQNSLITETKSEQSKYQSLISERESELQKEQLSLLEFESRLQFILDPNSIPNEGAILSWPLRSVRITQGFGCTSFARRNPQIYGGACFHPGIDLGASVGTKLTAPLSGVVLGTGNTDEKRGCRSFGKWIAIDHENGLTTIYAHLSIIKVREGQRLERGDLIGYTGNSGISTGPHLDFRVYATDGVRVVRYEQINPSTSCRGVQIPTAHKNAKLNPLDYLSKL